ncbi:hypothetical protein RhiirA1_541710 [Rhizophagus irregularis]|uniref:Transmembrane protein n=2 Tax=Rhizophagus irregularis TaxID=588596 RepID=A0A2N0R1Q7_9GLOM|nr:hypothetical protein RirG_196640 [Rhizophagus irregularis DAOM 197198w]PKC57238.1 hypothetical protein RhiirA1_541710 [Rhizophagus irregularis]UZO26695.1 hypothetical protein OCT59_018909 [Rhizophagus irregularis]GBC34247.1 hypothetical protein GLOIN_2v1482539 [Rhizophagus irregularis DAOM 181602=DAOM 197198]CAB4487991.1 unnamed protein product [Rhizophagus irregularis]
MKSFSFFVFLNVLILFAYAQNQTVPEAATCEQTFFLTGTTCTPCQQAIFKNNANPSFLDITVPSDKCLADKIFFYYLFLTPSTTPATPGTPDTPDERISQFTKKAIEDLDKTCAETANNACNESNAKNSYTEVSKACDAELNQYLSSNNRTGTDGSVGSITISTMLGYYMAIPIRENLCLKVNGEYCKARMIKNNAILLQANQTQSQQPNTFSFLSCDDECTIQSYNNIKSFLSSHPPDIPNLQKIINSTSNPLKIFENSCPNITNSIVNNSIASNESEIKSDGQKLTNQFYNYSGIILIGLFIQHLCNKYINI